VQAHWPAKHEHVLHPSEHDVRDVQPAIGAHVPASEPPVPGDPPAPPVPCEPPTPEPPVPCDPPTPEPPVPGDPPTPAEEPSEKLDPPHAAERRANPRPSKRFIGSTLRHECARMRALGPTAHAAPENQGRSGALVAAWGRALVYLSREGNPMSDDDVKAELERLRAENERLKHQQARGLNYKVSEKGAVSVYGLGRFPVTLYKEQWLRLLEVAEEIKAFIRENGSKLKTKGGE
jgi:hypothetical protein